MSQRAIKKLSVEREKQAVDPPRAKSPLFPINKFITLPNGLRPGKSASGHSTPIPVSTLPHKAGGPVKVVHLKYNGVALNTKTQRLQHTVESQEIVVNIQSDQVISDARNVHPGGLKSLTAERVLENQFKGQQQRVNTAVSGSHRVSTAVQSTSQSDGAGISPTARRYRHGQLHKSSPTDVQQRGLLSTWSSAPPGTRLTTPHVTRLTPPQTRSSSQGTWLSDPQGKWTSPHQKQTKSSEPAEKWPSVPQGTWSSLPPNSVWLDEADSGCLTGREHTRAQVNDVGRRQVVSGAVYSSGGHCSPGRLCTPAVFDHWHDTRNSANRPPVNHYSQPQPQQTSPANAVHNSHLDPTSSGQGVTHSSSGDGVVCRANVVRRNGNGTPAGKYVISEPSCNRVTMMGNYYDPQDFYGEARRMNLLQAKARFSSMPSLFSAKDGDYKKALKLEKKREKEERKRLEKEEKKRRKAEKKYASLNMKTLPKNWNYVTRPIEEVYLRPRMRLTAVPIDFEDGPGIPHSAPTVPPPPPPAVRMQNRALYSSAPDLLRIQQVYGTLSREPHKHHYSLPKV